MALSRLGRGFCSKRGSFTGGAAFFSGREPPEEDGPGGTPTEPDGATTGGHWAMFFSELRKHMKWVFAVLVVLFGGSLFFMDGAGLLGRQNPEVEVLARPVAEVNGHPISAAELQSAYRNNLAIYRQFFGRVQPGQSEQIMYQSLEGLVRSRLLLEAARQENVQVDPAAVRAELDQIKAAFPSEQDFRNQLRAARLTERDLEAMIREDLMVRQFSDEIRAQVTVTEEDVRADYEGVRARHILIRPEGEGPDWSEEAWAEARRRAAELREQLLAGADFEELAREHSADRASAAQGGDLGFFNRQSPLVDELKEAAFALDVGAISEPVRTAFGYHLIQVTERRVAEGEDFEAARAEIEERLRRERGEERLQEWLAARREESNIVIHDPRLRAFERAQNGQLEEALADYRLALEEDPFDPYLHVSVATVLQRLGRTDEGLRELEEAVEKSANDPELQLILGLAYRDAGRREDAARVLVQASETADWDPNIQFTVSRALADMGFEEEARAAELRFRAILEEWAKAQTPAGDGRIQFLEESWLDAGGQGDGGDARTEE